MAVLAVIGSALVLLSGNFLIAHAWMLSDSVYIGMTAISLAAVVLFLESNQRRFLLLAGLAAGLSILTRYVGISLLVAIGLTLLFTSSRCWRERFLDAVLVGSVGVFPFAGWIIRNELLDLPALGRQHVVLHLETVKVSLRIFFNTLWKWFVPGGVVFDFVSRSIILVILGCVLLAAAPVYWKRQRKGDPVLVRVQFLLIIFGIVYVTLAIASVAFSLADSPFSAQAPGMERYLVALFPVVVIFVSTLVGQWCAVLESHRYIRWVPLLFPACLIVIYGLQLIVLFSQPISLGYTDIKNYRPELVKALKAIALERPIVTNNYELIYYLVEKPVYSIPGLADELTGIPNPSHALLMKRVQRVVEDAGGAAVIFRPAGEQYFFDHWLERLDVYQNFGDFVVYVAVP